MTISESAERDLDPHLICARFTIIFNVDKISYREFLFVSGSYVSWEELGPSSRDKNFGWPRAHKWGLGFKISKFPTAN